MIFFELDTTGEFNEELECFERELEAAHLKVVIAHRDYNNGNLFLAVGTLMKREEEFAIQLAQQCFGKISSNLQSHSVAAA
jgi:hypothetical protein